jgi:protease II
VLDVMKTPQLRKYAKTLDLVKTALNPSHTLLCFGCDLHNNEYLKFYIKDIKNNTVHEEKFEGSVKNVQFNDDSSIFYLI